MKLTFVGTSHGVPSADRHCTCTMIESNGSVYFIDGGAPMVEAILRNGKTVKDLRAVFTTHVHSDHTVGIIQTASLINWYYGDAAADFYIPEQAHIDSTKNWIYTAGDGVVDENRIRFKIPTAGVVYEDENIKVEYIPTRHIKNSFAILVTEGDKRVLFGGDLSGQLKREDLPEIIKEELDGFICELSHFGMEHLSPYLPECRVKKIFFHHVFPLDKYNDIESIKGKYSFEVFSPYDGFEIEI